MEDYSISDDDELIYKIPSFATKNILEVRLFYVRISPCAVDQLPEHLVLRHLRRDPGTVLEINGSRIPPSEDASINLRRDRVDKESSESTYVSTDSIRLSGLSEFEVGKVGNPNYDSDGGNIILCGTLQRADMAEGSSWDMECYGVDGKAFCSGSLSIEVYMAGCCLGKPVMLAKTVVMSPRRKGRANGMLLDAIPEDEEMIEKDYGLITGGENGNGLVRLRKLQLVEGDLGDNEADSKYLQSHYPEDMYYGEDGQLSWFNAGVRVGVGLGLGMCLGVGIGVGLLMRSYQATTRGFRRRFF